MRNKIRDEDSGGERIGEAIPRRHLYEVSQQVTTTQHLFEAVVLWYFPGVNLPDMGSVHEWVTNRLLAPWIARPASKKSTDKNREVPNVNTQCLLIQVNKTRNCLLRTSRPDSS